MKVNLYCLISPIKKQKNKNKVKHPSIIGSVKNCSTSAKNKAPIRFLLCIENLYSFKNFHISINAL